MEDSAPFPTPELGAGSTTSSSGGPLPLPLHSSSGSSFVILDEDEDDVLEVSIPLHGAPSGSGLESVTTAAPVIAIEQPPQQPQQEIQLEEADDFFGGDEAFVSAAAPVEVAAAEPTPAASNVGSMAEGVEGQEEEEGKEFGDFEAPPPAPAQVAPAVPAEEAAAAPPQAQAEAPVIPQIGEEAVEHDDFDDDFGEDVEFVSAAAPPPAPTAAPTPSQAPQEVAEASPAAATMTVVPSVPAVVGTGADDAGDAARDFFEAAYGQGVGAPPTKEEAAEPGPWTVGGRRRLLAELDANLDSRCRVRTISYNRRLAACFSLHEHRCPIDFDIPYTSVHSFNLSKTAAQQRRARAPRESLGRRHPPPGAAGHLAWGWAPRRRQPQLAP